MPSIKRIITNTIQPFHGCLGNKYGRTNIGERLMDVGLKLSDVATTLCWIVVGILVIGFLFDNNGGTGRKRPDPDKPAPDDPGTIPVPDWAKRLTFNGRPW